jgi:hypothetical protein
MNLYVRHIPNIKKNKNEKKIVLALEMLCLIHKTMVRFTRADLF